MALTPTQQAGLSNATASLRSGGLSPASTNGLSPQEAYRKHRQDQPSAAKWFTFPPDLPKHHMILAARDYPTGASGALTGALGASSIQLGFVLPVPQMKLVDRYQVGYDDNYGYLEGLGKFTNSTAGRFIQGVTGLGLNKYKTVLMEAPVLKRHEFIWKLAPKTPQEADTIRNIVNNLKIAMAPTLLTNVTSLILRFPYIFDIMFNENADKLYTFKPSVIESLDVDYAGGNPQPAFYQDGYPESVVINMNLIEVEFWIREEFQRVHDASVAGTLNPVRDPLRNAPRIQEPASGTGSVDDGSTMSGFPGVSGGPGGAQ